MLFLILEFWDMFVLIFILLAFQINFLEKDHITQPCPNINQSWTENQEAEVFLDITAKPEIVLKTYWHLTTQKNLKILYNQNK